MKGNWERKKLKEICKPESSNISLKSIEQLNGSYPIYGASGLLKTIDFYKQEKSYIGLVKDGSGIGRAMLLPPKSSVIGTMLCILPKPGYSINYIKYAIDSLNLSQFKQGAAIPHIYFRDFGETELLVPSLEEQERVVSVLDEKFAQIDKLKENAEKNLQNAEDLFHSRLKELFGNLNNAKPVLLKDIAVDFGRGKSKHRPRNDKSLFGGDYPFIQTGEIRNADKYVTSYDKTYNEKGLSQSKLWPANTLCITIAANIAETAILQFPCCFPDSVIGFVANPKIVLTDYVYFLLQYFKEELQVLGKGTAQDNLNLAAFENKAFPLISLEEQRKVLSSLNKLQNDMISLKRIYSKQIEDCEELKQSFLNKAFLENCKE